MNFYLNHMNYFKSSKQYNYKTYLKIVTIFVKFAQVLSSVNLMLVGFYHSLIGSDNVQMYTGQQIYHSTDFCTEEEVLIF